MIDKFTIEISCECDICGIGIKDKAELAKAELGFEDQYTIKELITDGMIEISSIGNDLLCYDCWTLYMEMCPFEDNELYLEWKEAMKKKDEFPYSLSLFLAKIAIRLEKKDPLRGLELMSKFFLGELSNKTEK